MTVLTTTEVGIGLLLFTMTLVLTVWVCLAVHNERDKGMR